ncbi:ATP-binding protein [Sphingoaurantiacus capsulatus]|uniref:histidine kinase n=1 Tax=Sphingoaurantiacus capsulatus TaxID=1771310 RepID=A0ABV7X6I0_9SPHN
MKRTTVSERALVLAPRGRDATIAASMFVEAGIEALACDSLAELIAELDRGAAFAVVTEEAIATANLQPLSRWIDEQQEWSDLPFILLTTRGGGLERNPAASRHLDVLGNVTFLERPFHPTTLVSVGKSALRGRRRQYEARSRLAELHDSEERYRRLFDSLDEGFCVIEFFDGPHGPLSDYVHVEANPAYTRHAGIPDVVGKKVREMVGEEADGWVEMYRNVLLTGAPVRFERELVETGHFLELAAFRVEPPSRKQVAVLFQDITERRRAEQALHHLNDTLERRVTAAVEERESARAQLHEAQKLETLGQLTGGVAHDFNNLLTPITSALDLVGRKHGDDPRTARLVDGALQSAERAKTLVQRLLGFARRQSLETRAIDLAALVEGMRDLVASSVGAMTELHIVAEPGLPPALVDPNQLELAVLNLCVNARDAMPGGGTLTLCIDRPETLPADLPEGDYVRLAVVDTGEGMDEETLRRAVEPFYSTKELGKGTGLGLSMVHGLAAQLGGAFTLTSRPGEGTRADLYLPVANDVAAAFAWQPTDEMIQAIRPLSILLVDDEPLVRAATADMLREMGHTVIEEDSGAAAIKRLRGGAEIDLLITDYLMPEMRGSAVAEAARALRPGLPVLMITGYADLGEGEAPDLPRLPKPFRHGDLTREVARLFETTG